MGDQTEPRVGEGKRGYRERHAINRDNDTLTQWRDEGNADDPP